jgi:hypothetical protein
LGGALVVPDFDSIRLIAALPPGLNVVVVVVVGFAVTLADGDCVIASVVAAGVTLGIGFWPLQHDQGGYPS